MSTYAFAAPFAFALLPLPLAVRLLRPARATASGGLLVPETWRTSLPQTRGAGALRHSAVLGWFVWAALVAALAGPRVLEPAQALPASGRDIMLVLDLSGSMVERDFVIDGQVARRIDALKHVGADLIRRFAGDRVGLVVFADHAFAAAPLSFDVGSVAARLQQMEVGIVGRSTAIGDGMGLALKRLAASTSPSRVVVLLSDGANDAGATDPLEVAALAHAMGVRIDTIGLGVNDTLDPNGDPDPVDFEALRRIAEIGGGIAIRVRDTAELGVAADRLSRLLAGEAQAPPGAVWRELWVWPAAAGLLALAALMQPRASRA